MAKTLNIMGIRGVPAAHGGFETFAARLAPYLASKGWIVNVYCQSENSYEDTWEGVNRIHIASAGEDSLSSVVFDFKSTLDVLKRPGVDLVLGYNTAVFGIVQRLMGRTVLMNMDGIEWRRNKWGLFLKAWFYFNEFVGARTSTVAIADHPEIASHLKRHTSRESIVIPYGSDLIAEASEKLLERFDLAMDGYVVSIARIEPENSILDIVEWFSKKKRPIKLVVLGKFDEKNAYHRRIREVASEDVIFPGAIFDVNTLRALRFYCRAYLHGHQVGGTNPSLVEALGAGSAVLAHDNPFNRWVAGEDHFYFSDRTDFEDALDTILSDDHALSLARASSRARHKERFTWQSILSQYEAAIESEYVGARTKC